MDKRKLDKFKIKNFKKKNIGKSGPWTRFMDMHSGGGCKESPYEHIYIEAPENEATVIFYNLFGHSPDRVTCTCCGEDYSVSEEATLARATGYDRHCPYLHTTDYKKADKDKWYHNHYYVDPGDKKTIREAKKRGYEVRNNHYSTQVPMTIEEYLKDTKALFIFKEHIKREDRKGRVPKQGYVWMD